MLARIRKLLAMAEAEGLPEAARDSYNAKAAELIAQYGIDQALLAAENPTTTAPMTRTVDLPAPYARDKADLLWAVLGPLRCRGIRHVSSRGRVSMTVFGMPADVERAELLFTSLLVQAAHGLATARPYDPMESTAAYRRTWLAGFKTIIHDRLTATEQAASNRATDTENIASGTGRSVALVLVEQKDRVEAAVKAAYPKLKTARTRVLSGSGYYDGVAAGRKADIGGARVGAGQRRRAVSR